MRRVWTKDAIKTAIRQWVEIYGEPPTSKEWNGSRRPNWVPEVQTVRYYFGTWNGAIQAAGFAPRPRGAPGHLVPPARDERGRFLRN